MSTSPNEPALPNEGFNGWGEPSKGFTAKEAAAIALRVPDSGNDWLDTMIRTAQRNDLAKAAMNAMASNINANGAELRAFMPAIAHEAHLFADAMLSGAQIAEGE